jgi:effector-binding domain-containing protein
MARTAHSASAQTRGLTRRLFVGLVAATIAIAASAGGALAQAAGTPGRSSENILNIPVRPALIVQGTSEWADGYTAIENAFQRLRAETARAGLKATGVPVAVFVFTDDMGFRFQGMLPIEEPAAAPALGDEFSLGKTPGGRAVKFEHRGAYDEIDATYDAVTAWLDDRDLVAHDFLVEEWLKAGSSANDIDAAVDVYVFVK